jgi:hypothetical protein
MSTGAPRWPVVTGAVVGLACTVVGFRSLLVESGDTHPTATAAWVVALAVAHDLLVVPVVLAIGVAVKRLSPPGVRAPIETGLLVSGSLALIAWPLVRGYGRLPDNPSILPRDYGAGLVAILILVWVATLALALLGRRRRHLEPNGAPR